MKRLLLYIPLLALLASCNGNQKTQESGTLSKVTVDDFFSTPEQYLEKEIVITGLVTHVCKHGGQKLFIAGDAGEMVLRVNTSESIPEFGLDMEGSKVEFTGLVKAFEEEALTATLEEEAEHHAADPGHESAEQKANRNTEYYLIASSFRTL